MKIDQKKLERQEIGVYRFINSKKYGSFKDYCGTLKYCMGVGKTYTAILVMKCLFKIRDNNHFIVLVPSENLKLQWEKQLKVQFTKIQLLRIEVMTVNKIVKNGIIINTITLIADEIHEYTSDEFIKCINGTLIVKQELLGLTGTDDNPKVKDLLNNFSPVIDEIDEREAIKSGYISNFVEYNISTTLTIDEKTEYDRLSKVIADNISKFGRGGLQLANRCLSGGKHSNGRVYTGLQFAAGWASYNGWNKYLDLNNPDDKAINDMWNPHKVIGYAIKLINAVRERKNLLYSCENKVQLTLELVKKFDDIKTIVFSQSTNFADKVGLLINEYQSNSAVVYHSQLQSQMLPSEKTGKLIKFGSTRLRNRALNRIRTGASRVIVTATSLDRGFDVEDIRLGITASGTQNPTQYKQRSGRVKRKETIFSEETIVLVINIFIKDTKDEHWLKKRQSKSDHIIHEVDNIDNIVFKPKSNFNLL